VKHEYVALNGRIQQTLADLERVVTRTLELFEKAQKTADDGYLDGVALNLHGFYAGVERIFEDIARSVDGGMPKGVSWHRDLLVQMAAEIPATRPPVLRKETFVCLNDYLGFRHAVRNIYTFQLRPNRIQELAVELRPCYEALIQDMRAFASFLMQVSQNS
jgi:hypothetical protein